MGDAIGIGQVTKQSVHVQVGAASLERACPFCNAQPETLKVLLELAASIAEWFIYCPRCRCRGPIGDSKTLSAELWNEAELHLGT